MRSKLFYRIDQYEGNSILFVLVAPQVWQTKGTYDNVKEAEDGAHALARELGLQCELAKEKSENFHKQLVSADDAAVQVVEDEVKIAFNIASLKLINFNSPLGLHWTVSIHREDNIGVSVWTGLDKEEAKLAYDNLKRILSVTIAREDSDNEK